MHAALSAGGEEALLQPRPQKVLNQPPSVTAGPLTRSGISPEDVVNIVKISSPYPSEIDQCQSEDAVTIVKIPPPPSLNTKQVPSETSSLSKSLPVLQILISDSQKIPLPLKSPKSCSKVIPLPVPDSISSILQSGLAPTTFFDDSWSSPESQQGPMGNRNTKVDKSGEVDNITMADVSDAEGVQEAGSGMSGTPSPSSREGVADTGNVNSQSDLGSGVTKSLDNPDNLDNAKNSRCVDIQTRNNVAVDFESTPINNSRNIGEPNLVVPNVASSPDIESHVDEESKVNISPRPEEDVTRCSFKLGEVKLAPTCDKTENQLREDFARETSARRQITSLYDINMDDETHVTAAPSYTTVHQLRAMFAASVPSSEKNLAFSEKSVMKGDGHKKSLIENEHSTSNSGPPNDYLKQLPPSSGQAPRQVGAGRAGINTIICDSQDGEGSSPLSILLSLDHSKIAKESPLDHSLFGDVGETDKDSFPPSRFDMSIANGNLNHHNDNEREAKNQGWSDNDEKVLDDVTITGDKIMVPGANMENRQEAGDSEEDLDNDEILNMQSDSTAGAGECRISAEVRIVSKHVKTQRVNEIDGDLGESSDDSSLSSTFNEYSEDTQIQASSLTPFSMSTSSSGEAEADHHHLVVRNAPGLCLARLDLDPDQCPPHLSSLPEMFVDDDPSGTLSDVSPISDHESSIPNMPLESCEPTVRDINSEHRDNDIKFNEITSDTPENAHHHHHSSIMDFNHQNGQNNPVSFQLGPELKPSARQDLIMSRTPSPLFTVSKI